MFDHFRRRAALYAPVAAALAALNFGAIHFALAQVGGGVVGGGVQSGILGSSGPLVAVSGCGTGPVTLTPATNAYGTITEGVGSTGCTVTFNPVRNGVPTCQVTSRNGTGFPVLTYTVTATSLVWTNASASTVIFDYMCFGS